MAILTPALERSESTTIKKNRELPVIGNVQVSVGDFVKSDSVVASAELPGDLNIIRVSERMGIEPFEVMKGLKIKSGDRVEKGTLICEHRGIFGLFKSQFLAPEEGVAELISEKTGHVGVRLPSRPIELKAYISGVIAEVIADKGVTISTDGALIQGIFGVGGEHWGTLQPLKCGIMDEISDSAIPADCSGKILFGGAAPKSGVLTEAARRGAVGFICGSIDDVVLKEYIGFDLGVALTGDEDVSMTVIVTEGFGEIPMLEKVYAMLSRFSGKSASINGATQVRAGAIRPEIIISHEMTDTKLAAIESRSLEVGSKVRIIRVPYFSQTGQVTELPSNLEKIETGAFARIVRVKLDGGDVVTVPRANIELG